MVGFLSPTRHTFQNPGTQRKTPWPREQQQRCSAKLANGARFSTHAPPSHPQRSFD